MTNFHMNATLLDEKVVNRNVFFGKAVPQTDLILEKHLEH